MDNKRNGLLEIYRFILCFWPLYFHNYFLVRWDYTRFSVAELSVDFFFMLSGFFLLSAIRKLKDEKVFQGMIKLIYGRLKPMMITICFIVAFNLIGIAFFVRDDYFNVLHQLFMYWWFVLGLLIAIGLFYLIYRLLKSEKRFVIFLALLAAVAACVHYAVNVKGMLHYNVIYFTRTYGCISAGMLLSFIPKLRIKGFNFCIPIVALLIPLLFYLAYNKKNFFICILMILLFGALVYFSYNIPVGGKIFGFMGRLSVKIYLYMALLSMLYMLGLTDNKALFVINVTIAFMNTLLEYYRDKYRSVSKLTT